MPLTLPVQVLRSGLVAGQPRGHAGTAGRCPSHPGSSLWLYGGGGNLAGGGAAQFGPCFLQWVHSGSSQ